MEILQLGSVPAVDTLYVELTVQQFAAEFNRRFGRSHPDLVYRGESTLERARLSRRPSWALPKVVLRQGAPTKAARQCSHPGWSAES